uniref:Uncharacterized protein n=1 Tax=Oryza brachyantha TaxID=4533 RepID=J3KX61_ORYBR
MSIPLLLIKGKALVVMWIPQKGVPTVAQDQLHQQLHFSMVNKNYLLHFTKSLPLNRMKQLSCQHNILCQHGSAFECHDKLVFYSSYSKITFSASS